MVAIILVAKVNGRFRIRRSDNSQQKTLLHSEFIERPAQSSAHRSGATICRDCNSVGATCCIDSTTAFVSMSMPLMRLFTMRAPHELPQLRSGQNYRLLCKLPEHVLSCQSDQVDLPRRLAERVRRPTRPTRARRSPICVTICINFLKDPLAFCQACLVVARTSFGI